ncbi:MULTISPECIES: ArsA family ATPase [unclassified Streptomyces]|uniref:ArsA family ATPase n=1 Tax=unclassified Streptomyces TaxID=2593676 RepID=UPI0022B6CCE9|nr:MULTISPECIES: ArsA-related P-loop ATPase [unclassified Streptomyces]MCZ7413844.1 ArsA family ATPase [Streptomyces sp. WMMC897]MCZ7430840.1 ArsA family ATPase [Streptomyces sp. WMMC1477]
MRRTVLVTGAGGAGRSTVAAATALAAAGDGLRTVMLTPGPLPAAVAATEGLRHLRLDPAAGFRSAALDFQRQGKGVLDFLGAQPLEGDELPELPAAEPLALLRTLHSLHAEATADPDGAGWDVVVADLAPVREALGHLALPENLARLLARLLPPERQAARALHPLLAQLVGVPMPAERLYATAARWQTALAAVRELLSGPGVSVRLVVAPEAGAPRAVAEARAGLALHGLPLEAVAVNRLLPAGSPDPFVAALHTGQRETTGALRTALDPVPVWELPWLPEAPCTPGELAELGVPAPGTAPGPGPAPRVEDRLADSGELVWRLPLPGAVRERVELVRRGAEAIVTAGPYRRVLPLPGALVRCTVAGARLADGELAVRFRPDPALWPRGA